MLVINKSEAPIPSIFDRHGKLISGNTFARVYGSMLLQICLEYPSLPTVETMTANQIRFFYDGIRANLMKT